MPASPTITYFELLPGFTAFRCEPLRASLSPRACGQNHNDQRHPACQACPIGQRHAAEHSLKVHQSKPATTCVRCERQPGRRLLEHGICISCYNRQREVIRGRDRKGNVPGLQLFTGDLLLKGEAPAHGFAVEPVAPGAWLVSFRTRDEAELLRTVSTITAISAAQVIDWSISPMRHLETIPSEHSRQGQRSSWNEQDDSAPRASRDVKVKTTRRNAGQIPTQTISENRECATKKTPASTCC